MKPLSKLSGPWVGFWIQDPIRGHMRLGLHFESGRVVGGGLDRDGSFALQGTYDDVTGAVEIQKLYEALIVLYSGFWDGAMISGTSAIIGPMFFDEGSFEIWPEGEDEALNIASMELSHSG